MGRALSAGSDAQNDPCPPPLTFSPFVQNCVSHLPNLEELDIGWCKSVAADVLIERLSGAPGVQAQLFFQTRTPRQECSGSVSKFPPFDLACDAETCPRLSKLILTAIRTPTDGSLMRLAQHSAHLRQLDLLGSSNITLTGVRAVLESCQQLELLDLSFCRNVFVEDLLALRQQFPHVHIKKSFAF